MRLQSHSSKSYDQMSFANRFSLPVTLFNTYCTNEFICVCKHDEALELLIDETSNILLIIFLLQAGISKIIFFFFFLKTALHIALTVFCIGRLERLSRKNLSLSQHLIASIKYSERLRYVKITNKNLSLRTILDSSE